MLGLARLVMRGRSPAAMAATVLAMLALLLPVLSILSTAVVALVTLRKGPEDGLIVGGISALASGLLAYLLLGTPAPVAGFLLVLWLPVWLLGVLLRATRSLNLALQSALGFGLLLILVFNLQMGDPQAQWMELLQPVADGFVESELMVPEQSRDFVQLMAAWMTGIFAAGFYFQLALGLLLARFWQSRLFNPGGFREEFHNLRASRTLGLIGLPLLALTAVLGAEAPALARDVALLVSPLFFLQGLALAHKAVAVYRMNTGWLIALYVLLFIAMPHAEILVAMIGLVDIFIDFRNRWRPPPAPPAPTE